MEFKGDANVEELSMLLSEESPRCMVIVAAAFFDETLGRLLGDSKERSFHRRIEMALVFGLLTKDEGADLHTLRSIRNQFAHDLRTRTFNPDVVAQIERFRILGAALDASPSRDTVLPTPQDRFLYVVAIVGFRLQHRSKSPAKTGPLPEPELWSGAWPPLVGE